MSDNEGVLRRICRDLDEYGCPYALVGGLAVSARTRPRFTKDVDLAVVVSTDKDAEQLVLFLRARGYTALEVMESTVTGYLATVRFATQSEAALEAEVDLLFSSSGIEQEVVREAELIKVLGLEVPVARTGHLLALKVLSLTDTRQQDHLDIESLLRESTEADVQEARRALELITKRGFNREKALGKELDRLMEDFGKPRRPPTDKGR